MKILRWLRKARWFIAGFLALLVLAFGVLQLAPVRRMVATAVSSAASTEDTIVTIEGLEGWLPFAPRVSRVTVSDTQGTWLTLDDVSIDWSPFSLLWGNVVVDEVTISKVSWIRNPDEGRATSSSQGIGIPSLWIGKANLPSIHVDKAVAGTQAQLELSANCDLLDPETRAVLVAHLRETSAGKAAISADIAWDPEGQGLKLNLDIRDAAGGILARLAGLPEDVPLSVKGESQGALDKWRARVDASAGAALNLTANIAVDRDGASHFIDVQGDLETGEQAPGGLHGIVGDRAAFGLQARRSTSGDITLERVTAETPEMQVAAVPETLTTRTPVKITASSSTLLDGPVSVSLRAVPDRSWFDEGLGVSLAGAANAMGASVNFAGAVSPGEAGVTLVRGAKLSSGSVTLAGDVKVVGGLVEGELDFNARNMRDLSRIADLDMEGDTRGKLRLVSDSGKQVARVDLTSSRLRLDTTTLVKPRVTGRIRDPFSKPVFELDIVSPSVDAGGFVLDGAAATAKGTLAALDVTTKGLHNGAAMVARARLKVDHAPRRIALSALTLTKEKREIRLSAPVDLAIVRGGVQIPQARLSAGKGELIIRGKAGREMDLTLTPGALPLWVAGFVTDPLPLDGRVSGTARMSGLARERRVAFDLRFSELSGASLRQAPANLVVIAKGTTDRTGVTLKADLVGARGANLHASGRVPFDSTAPVSIEASGDADLSLANAWLGATGERATGRLSLVAKVTGTVFSPRVAGQGTIRDGFFRSPAAGLELRSINARFEGSERRIVLTSLEAKAPNGGTVSASGSVTLDQAAGYPVDLSVSARKAQLVATDLTTLTTALDARLTGGLTRAPRVSGTVNIVRWDIRLPERLSRPLTPIQVSHVNAPAGFMTGETGDGDGPDSAFNATLDLDVNAPREVFVRGQGVDAEFGGSAKLSGSIDNPAVRGRLDLRRGSMAVLSQRVTISRGTLQFLGDVEPILDIAGGITKNGVTATVSVKGKASDPQIALSSVPKLPQDEILSRLLFSKQTTQLSPFEAAQLAETVGKWSGLTSGPDIIDRLRTALGIDALSATTDENGATAVNAGRYVGRGVFVGVSQASGGSATVEVDITDEIKLRGEAGTKGTKVGVAAEWEY
jgi:autotransporter translocation and assembly factor TamB